MTEVLLVTNGLDPDRCARIEAEMQRKGYTAIIVSEGQSQELKAAGLNSELMCPCPLSDDFKIVGHMDYLGGLITHVKFDQPKSKKARQSLPNPSLRNRWGQIR